MVKYVERPEQHNALQLAQRINGPFKAFSAKALNWLYKQFITSNINKQNFAQVIVTCCLSVANFSVE